MYCSSKVCFQCTGPTMKNKSDFRKTMLGEQTAHSGATPPRFRRNGTWLAQRWWAVLKQEIHGTNSAMEGEAWAGSLARRGAEITSPQKKSTSFAPSCLTCDRALLKSLRSEEDTAASSKAVFKTWPLTEPLSAPSDAFLPRRPSRRCKRGK